ncbi:MAG: zinc ribbon domain-containing protein [Phycisphaeraceae bacterium]
MSEKKLILCPYCGNTQTEPEDRCAACGGFFDPLSLKVTQQHMGPWFVRDRNNPFRPGCSFEVLVRQIEKGKLKPTTIIRGPTTKQYWSVARHVPGVSHLLGYCHNCGAHVDANAESCGKCGEVFFAPRLRDNLGLAPAGADVHIQPRLSDTGAFEAMDERSHPFDQPIKLTAPGSGPKPGQSGSSSAAPGSAATNSIAATIASFSAARARQMTDQPMGSSILAGLRAPPPPEAPEVAAPVPGSFAGSSASPTDTAAVHAATAQAAASRDAMAWMTGPDQSELDSLASAVAGYDSPRRPGINLTTWVLMAVNFALLVAGVIVVIIAIDRNQPATPTTGNDGNGGTGGTPAQTGETNDMPPNIAPRRERPVDAPDQLQPTPPTPPTAKLPDAPAPPAPESPADTRPAVPLPTQRAPGIEHDPRAGNIFSDEEPKKLTPAEQQRLNWKARFAEAQEAEKQGKPDLALKIYQEIKTKAPADMQPVGLDQAIARVQTAIKRKPLEKFIGK